MRSYASTQVISGGALEGMHDLGEFSSGWVSEQGTRGNTDTSDITPWRIPVHEQFAQPRITQRMLDDAAFDVEGWLSRKVADKLAREENAAFVVGNGTDKPRGFTTYPAGSTNPGEIAEFVTGVNGNFAADPDGADQLINMIQGLKAQYRNNAAFAMNRLTTGGVRLLKDSDGRMLWQPSIVLGQPSTLLGYPVASMEDLPDYTTTDAQAIWFADWAEMYQIVDRLGYRVVRDELTQKPYILFYTIKRVGGDVVNFEAGNSLRFGS